jgi:uncharacterized protein (TIGR02145 family)
MALKCKLGFHSWDGYTCTQCGKEESLFLFSLLLDGQEQKCAKISKQIWMQTNLDVDSFRNGDKIPEAKTNEEWQQAGSKGQSAWCYYNNDPENGKKYGKLYNWYTVNDPRGLAPLGWHVPTGSEWTTLTCFLGGIEKAAKKMKNSSGWDEDEYAFNNNKSGFTGLPGGFREFSTNNFRYLGTWGCWWSSSSQDDTEAFPRTMSSKNHIVWPIAWQKPYGMSVRCIMDINIISSFSFFKPSQKI